MGLVFVLLGALIGGLSGGFWSALLGGAAGYLLAEVRQYRQAARQTAQTADPVEAHRTDLRLAPASADSALVRELTQRVQVLESQVSALQARVADWANAAPPAVPDPAPLMVGPEDAGLVQEEALALSEADLVAQALAATPADAQDEAASPVMSTAAALAPTVAEALVALPQEPAPLAAPATSPPQWDWPDADEGSTPRPAASERVSDHAPAREFKDFIPARLRPLVFGGNTIVKVGVLILFLGLSFLLKYVAEQVTVPIEMRYAGVALMGAGLLGLGWRLRDRRDASGARGYGLILQGAGVGVFYLTTLAAMKLHPLISAPWGFGVMVLITAFTAVLAVAQNAPWLAMVASTAGFATPVLVSTGQSSHVALFSYLAILDMGIVAMAWFRAWRPLNLIGFVGTFTLAGGWASAHYTPEVYASVQAFLLLFLLLFTAIGVLFARRALALGDEDDTQAPIRERAGHALRKLGRVDSSLVFGVPLAAYGLQYQMVRDDPWLPALSALVLGLFYVLLGGALWRGRTARYALLAEAYVVVGVLFGTLSVPLALEGVWTGATWAVEAAGMYWLGTRQHRTYTRSFALALMAGAAARTFSSLGWPAASDAPLLTGSVLGVGMLSASALSVGLVQRRARGLNLACDMAAWERSAVSASWHVAVAALAVLP